VREDEELLKSNNANAVTTTTRTTTSASLSPAAEPAEINGIVTESSVSQVWLEKWYS